MHFNIFFSTTTKRAETFTVILVLTWMQLLTFNQQLMQPLICFNQLIIKERGNWCLVRMRSYKFYCCIFCVTIAWMKSPLYVRWFTDVTDCIEWKLSVLTAQTIPYLYIRKSEHSAYLLHRRYHTFTSGSWKRITSMIFILRNMIQGKHFTKRPW